MQVVYAKQPFPEAWSKALFLAGPTPRSTAPVPSWRPAAMSILASLGYDGVVFVPEAQDGAFGGDYVAQIDWETEGLHLADLIVFWVPREIDTMPAFTTNVEFGRWIDSHKCVLGRPNRAPKMRYLDVLYEAATGETPAETLEATLARALSRLGAGALRRGGERCVPLQLWDTVMFRSWYGALIAAGHRLLDARVRWVFTLEHPREVFSFVLWVKVHVEGEGRVKDNEWIFARTDISAVVLYGRPQGVQDRSIEALLDTSIVLVREFRAPARTGDGFVHELPGGSSRESGYTPAEIAADEVREETSLVLTPERFTPVGSRQIAATLSSHHARVFAVALSPAEMEQARALAGTVHGQMGDSERTIVEITTLRAMLAADLVDWSTIGMVCAALIG